MRPQRRIGSLMACGLTFLNDLLKASTPHGWVDGGTCRLVGSREAVRPRTGFGEAVRGIAGWRAGAGEQGGIGSIPHKTRAQNFYKTADCLKANTPHGWEDGGICRLCAVGWMAAFAARGRHDEMTGFE